MLRLVIRQCSYSPKKGTIKMITQQIVDYNGIRVLTSLQIADAYETTTTRIKQNFNKNKVDLLNPVIYNDIQKVR